MQQDSQCEDQVDGWRQSCRTALRCAVVASMGVYSPIDTLTCNRTSFLTCVVDRRMSTASLQTLGQGQISGRRGTANHPLLGVTGLQVAFEESLPSFVPAVVFRLLRDSAFLLDRSVKLSQGMAAFSSPMRMAAMRQSQHHFDYDFCRLW